ncbi:MAG: response regulator [Gemmatimonadota bacterium]|nr:response regulator [Gemmatimonadota bacterium]
MSNPVEAERPIILLVEDNSTIRNAFGILLEESGYRVRKTGSGEEALVLAGQEPPHLVLMDMGLPDMNGLEVTRRLMADPRTNGCRVVALTGHALDTNRDSCSAAGCIGYLTKPVDTAKLLRLIPGFLA